MCTSLIGEPANSCLVSDHFHANALLGNCLNLSILHTHTDIYIHGLDEQGELGYLALNDSLGKGQLIIIREPFFLC